MNCDANANFSVPNKPSYRQFCKYGSWVRLIGCTYLGQKFVAGKKYQKSIRANFAENQRLNIYAYTVTILPFRKRIFELFWDELFIEKQIRNSFVEKLQSPTQVGLGTHTRNFTLF